MSREKSGYANEAHVEWFDPVVSPLSLQVEIGVTGLQDRKEVVKVVTMS